MPPRVTACNPCPAFGKVLALTILYEIHDISRFDRVQEFASYARLVKGRKQSGGKMLGPVAPRWATCISSGPSRKPRSSFSGMRPAARSSSPHRRRNTGRGRHSRSSLCRSQGKSAMREGHQPAS
ncbi:MAG: transposase [Acidobacteria bacterium]|nr:transposase [Acidobacteriota bacterium]